METRKFALKAIQLEGNSGHPKQHKQDLCVQVTNHQSRTSNKFPWGIIRAGLSSIFTSLNLGIFTSCTWSVTNVYDSQTG